MSDLYPGDHLVNTNAAWNSIVEAAAAAAINTTSTNPTPQAQALAREAARATLRRVSMSIADYMMWLDERD